MARKVEFDRETQKTPLGPGTPAREIEARMGQYLVAFGAGAEGLRISRRGVDLLRYRYLPCVRDVATRRPRAWDEEAPHVLSLMTAVGRVAASLATERGEMTIRPADVWTACERVESALLVRERQPTDNHPVESPVRPVWVTPERATKTRPRR